MILDTRIAGIPCRVQLEYHPPLSGSFDQPEEGEGFTIECVLDRRGRPADWLAAKLTEADIDAIMGLAFTRLRGDREDFAHEIP